MKNDFEINNIHIHDNLVLDCLMVGNPEPTYVWYKDELVFLIFINIIIIYYNELLLF